MTSQTIVKMEGISKAFAGIKASLSRCGAFTLCSMDGYESTISFC